jgi:hypothetical protein
MSGFRINAVIDTSQLELTIAREQKRLAYNVVAALNKTALHIQAKIRADMEKVFVLRRTAGKDRKWLLDRVKVKFASVKKGLLYAEIYLDQKPRLLLAQLEQGGQREPVVGKSIAVPVAETAREGGSIAGGVQPALTFKQLRLRSVKVKPGKQPDAVQFKGLHRTFLLKHTARAPMGGVFVRTGPGKGDIEMIYSFKKAFQLKQLMHLVRISQQEFHAKFAVEMTIAYAGRDTAAKGG